MNWENLTGNMDSQHSPLLLVAYGFSNFVGLLILWAAFRRPGVARLALVLLFGWAAWTNYHTCHKNPEMYLGYSRYAVWYGAFIRGWFGRHITPMVSTIAVAQGLIALGLLYRGIWVKAACTGVIIFLLAIAPLGFGAAFPFPLIVAFAAWKIMPKAGAPLWSGQAYQLLTRKK
ncbi:hypothetical protein [Mucilaginibacter sp. UR6-11]|uniref:hypothetical protein n=1 Tax=Mucilaginibacter sp. UR6-11 TaxID=1435644 RepID=UPI001E2EA5F4|nr:hypothetical protein [Mucilaginibacter sp. UR6-11]MCC8426419.1 hypothetical protein [Mucilaginibacter sp. UR6-11]